MANIYTEAAEYILDRIPQFPSIGILTGSGLGFAGFLEEKQKLNYRGIPNFPAVGAQGHTGTLHIIHIGGVDVALFSGRLHYYEGHPIQACGFPIHLMHELGVTDLIMSNVSGSVNAQFPKASVLLLKDHINLMGVNPLRAVRNEEGLISFPEMVNAYRRDRNRHLLERAHDPHLHEGIYAAFAGPSLETRQEYKMASILGADVVGMSTVPEIIAAASHKMSCNVLSLVSNECFGDHLEPTSIESVLAVADENKERIFNLIKMMVEIINNEKESS